MLYEHSAVKPNLKYGINSQAYSQFKAEDVLYNILWFTFIHRDQVILHLVICPLCATANVNLLQTVQPLRASRSKILVCQVLDCVLS